MANEKINEKITVDNLPLDYSVQFEQQKSQEDRHLLDDADTIQLSVSKDTLQPTKGAVVDTVITPPKTITWGGAEHPNMEGYSSTRVFHANCVSKTFGSQDKLDAMDVRIDGIKTEQTSKLPSGSREEIKGVEKEANRLSSLVEELRKMNDILEQLFGEMRRYKKG